MKSEQAAPNNAERFERIAWPLESYAETVRACHSTELERFPYLPEIEECAEFIRAAALAAQAPPDMPQNARNPLCKERCQYSVDMDMPLHRCGDVCVYAQASQAEPRGMFAAAPKDIRIPTDADEAEVMARMGIFWLSQNAPDRLTRLLPAPPAAQKAEPSADALEVAYSKGWLDRADAAQKVPLLEEVQNAMYDLRVRFYMKEANLIERMARRIQALEQDKQELDCGAVDQGCADGG